MARRIIKWLGFILLGIIVLLGAIYVSLAWSAGEQAVDRMFFQNDSSRPLIIAHRGAAGLAPENTLYAFERMQNLGVDVIELDVRSTSDGTLIVLHDATVDRTTEATGRVADLTLAELKRLDAGYRWTPDDGKSFPFRGRGITVPTLQEVFAALPAMRFNIEPKHSTPSPVKPLCDLLREQKMLDRVIVGSFNGTILDEFRRECGEVATSASPSEVSKFLAMYKTGLSKSFGPAMQALQVPEYAGALQVVSKDFVAAAHERNLKVHVWTVNETIDMERLLEMGVDGIMTDYPDRLIKLLGGSPAQ